MSAPECRWVCAVRLNRAHPCTELLVGRTQDRVQYRSDLTSSNCRECPNARDDVSFNIDALQKQFEGINNRFFYVCGDINRELSSYFESLLTFLK
jgi:hypothetical protein